MALPQTLRVKLSSEAAESIALTPVVVQEMAIREVVGHMLGLTGKDERRVREILLRGSMVSGASRFRWTGWEAAIEDIRALLATFPDPDPSLPFSRSRCVRAVLRATHGVIEIPRLAAEAKGLFRRTSFWDLLMEVAAAQAPQYAGYSYRDHADRYARELTAAESERLRGAERLLPYTSLRNQLRSIPFHALELFTER